MTAHLALITSSPVSDTSTPLFACRAIRQSVQRLTCQRPQLQTHKCIPGIVLITDAALRIGTSHPPRGSDEVESVVDVQERSRRLCLKRYQRLRLSDETVALAVEHSNVRLNAQQQAVFEGITYFEAQRAACCAAVPVTR